VKTATFENTAVVVRDGYALGSYVWREAVGVVWRRFLLNEVENEVLLLVSYDTFSDGKTGGWERGNRNS